MTGVSIVWFCVGLAAAAAHVWMLWRSAQPPFHGVGLQLPRMLLVGVVLFASAVSGGLFPTIVGWAIGYFSGVAFVAARRTA